MFHRLSVSREAPPSHRSTSLMAALRNTCLIMICVSSGFFRSQSWIDAATLLWLLILYVMTGYWFMWSDDAYCGWPFDFRQAPFTHCCS